MPHVTVEYSDNLIPFFAIETLLPALQQTFAGFDTIVLSDIITRAKAYAHYEVGDKGREGAFMHVSILMYQGRPQALRTQIGEALVAVLTAHLKHLPAQLSYTVSVEIREMERHHYFYSKV